MICGHLGMKTYKKFITFVVLINFCLTAIFAHDLHKKSNKNNRREIRVKTVKITDKIYMLAASGGEIGVGNIGVSVGEDGILMIDTQLASLAPKIKSALKKLSSDKPHFVINTHWHSDHTGGNEIFGKDATIIAQENVRKRLLTERNIFEGDNLMPKIGLPTITFDQSLSLNFNGEKIRIIHFPNGHTDGDSVIFFTRSIVAHLGDLYKGHRFPGVDLGHGGNVKGLAKNIGDIIAMLPEDVKIIPGHGDLATLNDLKDYHQMLLETIAIVEKAINDKKTLEQIKKEGFPAKFNSWSNGLTKIDSWIEQIYKSLTMETK